MRRIQLLVQTTLALGAFVFGTALQAQDSFRNAPVPRLVVEPDRDDLLGLSEAGQLIERKQYLAAVKLLQHLLDQPEDCFLEADFLDDHAAQGGIRKEVLRILTSLPSEGLASYELEYGAVARQLLTDAVELDDLSGIAEVSRRFAVTSAGYDATTRLAAYASDANRPLEAALLLEPLRNHPRRTPLVALQRAVYWSRAGRLERGVAALRELKKSVPTGKMRIGGREVTLPVTDEAAAKWLPAFASRNGLSTPSEVATWSMPGGEPGRNASAAPASPVGGSVWRISALEHLTLDGRPDEDHRHQSKFQESLDRVHQSLIEENRPTLTAAQPLVIGDTVVYRTIGDVTAVSLRTGELLWRSSLVDESLIRLMNARSLEARLRTARGMAMDAHLERRTFRDLAAGTLSSDGRAVFALEELEASASFSRNALGMVSEARAVNKLVAYDLAGGRMLWEVGGPRGSQPADLSAQFFLGAPLAVDDDLYVISEVQGALKLLALKQDADRRTVRLDWSQTLIATDQPLAAHPLRRLSGLAPSLSDGVLVCPTSTGAVVAIDLARRVLLWGFQYPSVVRPSLQNGMMFQGRSQQEFNLEEADKSGRWMDNSPVIADGKVLITARDSSRLYCLDLVDGHEIWRMSRDDWMYVACVVDGRAILVGRHGIGAVQMDDGTVLDSFTATRVEPSGRGIRVGTSYFLPTTAGEIATIDLRNGQVVARSKLAGGLVPGNLAAGGGAIVSQGVAELVGFSRLGLIEQQVADELKADPRNPRALALRGELRLHGGNEVAGLADLRASLKTRPDPHVKSVLAAVLLAGARAQPDSIREHVAELETITDDPEQKNEFLRLYSQALEASGDRRGAFSQMIRLAQTSQFLAEIQPVEAGYSVRADRSIRARLIGMYTAASPAERLELNRTLEEHIRASVVGNDPFEHLERLLRFFSGLPTAESLLLSSALEIDVEDANLPRRESLFRWFLRSNDVGVAARATAVQCADLIKARRWSEAVPLIDRLRREFADRECLDGQTGGSLAEKWSALEDLRPLLVTAAVWAPGPIDPRRRPRAAASEPTYLTAEIVSRSGTSLAGWSFDIDPVAGLLLARDALGVLRWKLTLPNDAEFIEPEQRVAIPCQIHIHDNWLAVSRWSYFLVVDASSTTTPRIAWQQSLRTSAELAQQQQIIGVRRNIRFGSTVSPQSRTGQVLGMTRETVIYTVGTKLRAAELETGRLAWSRQDVISGQVDGSADDQAVVIHSNGITLLRTLDGARLAKRILQPGTPLWSRGSQLLVLRSKSDKAIYELRDTIHDTVIWSRDCPVETLATVVEETDVAFLEPTGLLVMTHLADGRERYQVELPLKLAARDKSWMTVQRSAGLDVILGGETNSQRTTTQVIPFVSSSSRTAVAFDGYVCGVSTGDGKLQWATPVEKAAFDKTQPSSSPVLLLATRQYDPRNTGNPFAQRFRMNAEILDKRTGRSIYSIEETAPLQPPRLEPEPDSGRIVVNFHDWQLDLTLPVQAKATP
jgi:outer membrane protein assembly factor BamB